MHRPGFPTLALAGALLLPGALAAQDTNILLRVEDIEHRLRSEPFQLLEHRDTRFEGDRTQRATIQFADGTVLLAKLAPSARGGEAFNNQPRYELAAYELQKLFLDEAHLVVPPTVARAFPLDWYRTLDPEADPTFDGAAAVLTIVQYWLSNVSSQNVFDPRRLESDTAYARHFGNLNLLTHLIWHSDANTGNVLISSDSMRPRLFSVDNGVAFGSDESDRGTVWRTLRTRRLPASTVERLRRLSREELEQALGVVAQFEVRDGELVPVPRTGNLAPGRGIRRRENVIQLGLTEREIRNVEARLQRLLRRVDAGALRTF